MPLDRFKRKTAWPAAAMPQDDNPSANDNAQPPMGKVLANYLVPTGKSG